MASKIVEGGWGPLKIDITNYLKMIFKQFFYHYFNYGNIILPLLK